MAAVERNAPCPCGSGKKYKQCCLAKPAAGGSSETRAALQEAIRHQQTGRLSEAEQAYRRVLTLEPDHHEALHRFGLLAHQSGRPQLALELLGRAARLRSDDAMLLFNLGIVQQALGLYDAAADSYRRLLERKPHAVAQANLGFIHYAQGRFAEAVHHSQRALALDPAIPQALNNLGASQLELGRADLSVEPLRRALAIDPRYAEAHNNLGMALAELGQAQEALGCYQKAVALMPGFARAYNNAGTVFMDMIGRLDDATACFERARALQPGFAMAHHNLGTALLQQGRLREALSCFDRAIALQPDLWLAHDSRLFVLSCLPDLAPAAVLEAHRDYARRVETPLSARWRAHDNIREPERRLKVGYVSADFRLHSVAFFMEPVLAQHDKGAVEVYCYYNHTARDAVTERLMACTDHWIPCRAMSDDELAERIRADGIDVLVDLSGHTAGNRLLTFARRPAPVQVTYLGYVATTGLSAMDWRLSHTEADPPGSEAWYSERLYRLPRSLWCYRPAADLPEIPAETPARRNGFMTFASVNNVAKLSDATLALWAGLLHALPTARLVLAVLPAGRTQQWVRERFAALGIAPERLELHDKMPHREFRALHARVDVALDPFPLNGNTTTCETLCLGVPVITRTGERFLSRLGRLLLDTVGLPELVARDETEYVAIAQALAQDLDRLEALRRGLRARIEASPLRDERGFVADLEAAYREMWRTWCAAQRPASSG